METLRSSRDPYSVVSSLAYLDYCCMTPDRRILVRHWLGEDREESSDGDEPAPEYLSCHKKAEEAESGSLKRCAKCHVGSYCSRECQKAHWKVHKKVSEPGERKALVDRTKKD